MANLETEWDQSPSPGATPLESLPLPSEDAGMQGLEFCLA